MSALSISANSSYISTALAQQQVQGDQAQVQSVQAQLAQAQAKLDKDSAQAATEQQQSQKIQQNLGLQAQQAGLSQLAPPVQSTPTVNTIGQMVGKIINIVA